MTTLSDWNRSCLLYFFNNHHSNTFIYYEFHFLSFLFFFFKAHCYFDSGIFTGIANCHCYLIFHTKSFIKLFEMSQWECSVEEKQTTNKLKIKNVIEYNKRFQLQIYKHETRADLLLSLRHQRWHFDLILPR